MLVQETTTKPRLLVETADPDRTVAALRDILVCGRRALRPRRARCVLPSTKSSGALSRKSMTPDAVGDDRTFGVPTLRAEEKSDGTIVEEDSRLPRNSR